jgi:hypothetical protein
VTEPLQLSSIQSDESYRMMFDRAVEHLDAFDEAVIHWREYRRRSRTGNPCASATSGARKPSDLPPKNRTMGSTAEWPSPPWQDSRVSTLAARKTST